MKIGIGITNHNRNEVYYKTLQEIIKHSPYDAKIITVDDASATPIIGANYRFEENVGISVAKNKCLELLEDCEHIFLFDSDIYPLLDDWWVPYVLHKEQHLNLSFEKCADGTKFALSVYVKEKLPNTWVYSNPNGCMMYLTNKVLQTVGGFDIELKGWGLDHTEYTRRIHNAGLTTYMAMDIPNAINMFYSYDYHKTATSSITEEQRKQYIKHNLPIFKATKDSKEFKPYK